MLQKLTQLYHRAKISIENDIQQIREDKQERSNPEPESTGEEEEDMAKAKTVCPNCGGDKFMPVHVGNKQVKGQKRCTNQDCGYVVTEEK